MSRRKSYPHQVFNFLSNGSVTTILRVFLFTISPISWTFHPISERTICFTENVFAVLKKSQFPYLKTHIRAPNNNDEIKSLVVFLFSFFIEARDVYMAPDISGWIVSNPSQV
jgi:hypothetical protein